MSKFTTLIANIFVNYVLVLIIYKIVNNFANISFAEAMTFFLFYGLMEHKTYYKNDN
jgi:hypothetical protein